MQTTSSNLSSSRGGIVAWCRCGLAAALAASALLAAAQSHEVSEGDFVLRSSTVTSQQIDPTSAARHGIEVAPNRAVFNVVLLRGADRQPVPAKVTASSRNLAGMRSKILLREVREDEWVSYVGSFDFVPREVLDFVVEAQPAEGEQQPVLTLSYRDRMPGL